MRPSPPVTSTSMVESTSQPSLFNVSKSLVCCTILHQVPRVRQAPLHEEQGTKGQPLVGSVDREDSVPLAMTAQTRTCIPLNFSLFSPMATSFLSSIGAFETTPSGSAPTSAPTRCSRLSPWSGMSSSYRGVQRDRADRQLS